MKNINKRVCMLGVCGAGMAPLAIYLSQRGYAVYGWDDNVDLQIKDMLTNNNIVFIPKKTLPPYCDYVVRSSAVNEAIDEICQSAKNKNIPIFRRGEFLSQVCADKKLIAIIGSHGKTSVSGSCVEILASSGIKFDYVIGGFFKNDIILPSHYEDGAEWLVAEIDESDGTMNNFSPECTIALNFDDDHIGNYGGSHGLQSAFHGMFERTKSTIFITGNDAVITNIANDFPKKIEVIKNLETDDFQRRNHRIAEFCIKNIFKKKISVPSTFVGIRRRNDVMLSAENFVVINDYAHHPTEIAALLKYSRQAYSDYDINIIFQPHRMTRTQQYFLEFAKILDKFDNIAVVELYTAFENKIDGVSSKLVFDAITNKNKRLFSLKNFQDETSDFLKSIRKKKKKQLVLFVGAGNIIKQAKVFISDLSAELAIGKLIAAGMSLVKNKDITNIFSIRVKTTAQVYVEPSNESDLATVLAIAKHLNIKHVIVGNGTNILPPDGGIDGIVIKLSSKCWKKIEWTSENEVYCSCGVCLNDLCRSVSERGYSGIEKLWYIPGSIGGGIRMNAGSHGQSISDNLVSITTIGNDGNITVIGKDDIKFSYRHASIPGNPYIIGAKFLFKKKMAPKNFETTKDDLLNWRRTHQPNALTFGSIFKNNDDISAGELIDKCGLKGTTTGRAKISQKHANFIENSNGATSKEIEQLIDTARYEAFNLSGEFLKTEVVLLRA